MDNLEKAEAALNLAKINLLGRKGNTFLSTVLFSLDLVWDDMEDFPPNFPKTLYTDGTKIGINPTWFLNQTPGMRLTGLAHETWHVCFKHPTRRGERDPRVWNWAGDFVINLQCVNDGMELTKPVCTLDELLEGTGKGYLLDYSLEGLSTDEIYDKIIQTAKEKAQARGESGDGLPIGEDTGFGEDLLPPELTEGQTIEDAEQQLDSKIDSILMKAQIQDRLDKNSSGSIPGEIARYIDELFNPKIPWQHVLQNHLTSFSKDDYSYRLPNRVYLEDEDGIIMPSLYSESLGSIAMICDASCSVTEKEFSQFVTESRYVKNTMNPQEFSIVSFDTNIRSVEKFSQYESMGELELKGGGGTSIGPVIDWLNKETPDIAVVFTDGYFQWPSTSYTGELIWLIYNNPDFTAPFGKIIHFN